MRGRCARCAGAGAYPPPSLARRDGGGRRRHRDRRRQSVRRDDARRRWRAGLRGPRRTRDRAGARRGSPAVVRLYRRRPSVADGRQRGRRTEGAGARRIADRGRHAAGPALGGRVGAHGGARRRHLARRQARDERSLDARGRRHPRAQHGQEALVADQGRMAGGAHTRRDHRARHFGRRRRRPERHRVGTDGRGREHVRRRARYSAALRRRGGISAGRDRAIATRRRSQGAGDAEARRPASRAHDDARHRVAARRDGRRGGRCGGTGLRRSAHRRSGRRRSAYHRGRASARGNGAGVRSIASALHRVERRDDRVRHRSREGRPQSGIRPGGLAGVGTRRGQVGARPRAGSRFSTRWAISSTRVRPAPMSATSK